MYCGQKEKETFRTEIEKSLFVAKTGQLSNQIVRDLITFADVMGCHDDIEIDSESN